MKFATIRELNSGTSQVLKDAEQNDGVVITKFGKPRYLLVEIDEDELEDFILAKHYNLETAFEKARKELTSGKTKSLNALLHGGGRRGK